MTDRPPRVVRRPLLTAALTLLKRWLWRHHGSDDANRGPMLHQAAAPLSDNPERLVGGDAIPTVAGDAAAVGLPASDPALVPGIPKTRLDPCPWPITEGDVRTTLRALVEQDETLTPLAPDMVSDTDIREACRSVTGWQRLEVKRETALFYAAMTAIQIAERRLGLGA